MSKQPSYVRCIKPNHDKKPGEPLSLSVCLSVCFYVLLCESCYMYSNLQGIPSSPTYLPLPAVEHLLFISSAMVWCGNFDYELLYPVYFTYWFTGEAIDMGKKPQTVTRDSSHIDKKYTKPPKDSQQTVQVQVQ